MCTQNTSSQDIFSQKTKTNYGACSKDLQNLLSSFKNKVSGNSFLKSSPAIHIKFNLSITFSFWSSNSCEIRKKPE